MVALVAEGGAVAARAAALLGHVQVPLAVEGDPVLGPWLLVAPLAGYFLKGITLVTQANVLQDASGDYAGLICIRLSIQKNSLSSSFWSNKENPKKLDATCHLNYTYL